MQGLGFRVESEENEETYPTATRAGRPASTEIGLL